MEILSTFWWFLVLIGVLILLHELGHYLVARFFDVKIEAFSFGFGPRLFGAKRGETDFKVCAIPMGGYVKMAGEQPGEEGASDPRAFPNKPRWQRLLIIFAGPAVNIVLAVAILTGLYMIEYRKVPDPQSPLVGAVTPGGAAERAGIRPGDRVLRFDGKTGPTWWTDIALKEVTSARRAIPVTVERGGQRLDLTLTPDYSETLGMGTAGWGPEAEVVLADYTCDVDVAKNAGIARGDVFVSINGQPVKYPERIIELIAENKDAPATLVYRHEGVEKTTTVTPVWNDCRGTQAWRIGASLDIRADVLQLPFGQALDVSIRENTLNGASLYIFLKGMFEQRISAKNLDGPIGIANMSNQAAKMGIASFLKFMALVSMNLAVVNLLPIPVLDGGGILMLLIEMLMQRDLSLRVKEAVIKFGLVCIMALVVFVMYNDISKRVTRDPAPKSQTN